MQLHAFAAAVLAAAGTLWVMSDMEKEQPVLGERSAEVVRATESSVATHPNDPSETASLARQYVDVRQPGLAIALIEGAPTAVREDVRVAHAYARALVDEGHNSEALKVQGRVIATCRTIADGRKAPVGCDPVLLASAMRRADILRELISLGIEDSRAHPEETLVAYQNATREARVALE
jgi:hypothetical protein